MSGDFLDTNILIYLLESDIEKAERAAELLADRPIVSVQVLNEVVATGLRKRPTAWRQLRDFLALVQPALTVVPVNLDVHLLGIDLIERYRFATYDAMIVAAGLLAGCETLWSEDMQAGLLVEGQMTVRNPF